MSFVKIFSMGAISFLNPLLRNKKKYSMVWLFLLEEILDLPVKVLMLALDETITRSTYVFELRNAGIGRIVEENVKNLNSTGQLRISDEFIRKLMIVQGICHCCMRGLKSY